MPKRYYSRRQLIASEQRSGMIRLIVLVVLLLALVVMMISNCADCGTPKAPETPAAQQTAAGDEPEEMAELAELPELPEGIRSYPRLINAEHMMAADYIPPELTLLYGLPDGMECRLSREAAVAFTKLYNAMVADGLAMIPLSGYRSYDEQVALFNYNVTEYMNQGLTQEEATLYTLRFISRPGGSEHQSGLAIDVTTDGTTQHDFQHTDQGRWLLAHADEYGFVVRYPEDKNEITGIEYEPWHLRYVGQEHALYMAENDLCLEEYVELVRERIPSAAQED